MNKVETLDLQKMNKVKCNYFFCYHQMMKIEKDDNEPTTPTAPSPSRLSIFWGSIPIYTQLNLHQSLRVEVQVQVLAHRNPFSSQYPGSETIPVHSTKSHSYRSYNSLFLENLTSHVT